MDELLSLFLAFLDLHDIQIQLVIGTLTAQARLVALLFFLVIDELAHFDGIVGRFVGFGVRGVALADH